MRYAKQVVASATPTSLANYLDIVAPDARGCEEVILQAPSGNAINVLFGTRAAQPGFIEPGGSASLEVNNLENVWIKGDGVISLVILVLR